MTTEPPKGIKANLKRLYQILTEQQFNACEAKEKYKKLLFSLCYFHAVLLERKKFQQLGWNVVYSFNDSDFEVRKILPPQKKKKIVIFVINVTYASRTGIGKLA